MPGATLSGDFGYSGESGPSWSLLQWTRFWRMIVYLFGEGNGTLLQYSCLENPMDRGAWWAAVHGIAKSGTWLSNFIFTLHSHALEKEMATHSSVLAWRIPGMAGPGGLPSMGLHRVGHDWSDWAAAAAAAAVYLFFNTVWVWVSQFTENLIQEETKTKYHIHAWSILFYCAFISQLFDGRPGFIFGLDLLKKTELEIWLCKQLLHGISHAHKVQFTKSDF